MPLHPVRHLQKHNGSNVGGNKKIKGRTARLIKFLIAITIMDATITLSFKNAITKIKNKQLKIPTCIIMCA